MSQSRLISKVKSAFVQLQGWQKKGMLRPVTEMDVAAAMYYNLVDNSIVHSDIHLNYTLRPKRNKKFLRKIGNKEFVLVDVYIEKGYDPLDEGDDDPDILIEIKKIWYPASSLSKQRKDGIYRDLQKLFWLTRIYPNSKAVMIVLVSTEALNQMKNYKEVMGRFEKRYGKSVKILWNR